MSNKHSHPKVRLEGVHKSFGGVAVLRGIDIAIGEGEVLALIGPSGGGKSTLLRCINLLQPIDKGSIYLDDQVITNPGTKLANIRKRVGMVFQHFNLFPHLTAIQNLTLAPRKVLKMERPHAEERANQLLSRVGLADRAAAYPAELSGGQQQRVAIARALMLEPEVMLFDEVTSALDPELVGEVLDVMTDLAASGMTMMVVTHEMQFASDVATRAVFMADGVVVETGEAAEMLQHPTMDRTKQFLFRTLRRERLPHTAASEE